MKKSVWQPNYIFLREALKKIRHDAGLSQRALAKRMNKSHSYVAKYEIGERNLDFFEVIEVCLLCDANPENFLKHILLNTDLKSNS